MEQRVIFAIGLNPKEIMEAVSRKLNVSLDDVLAAALEEDGSSWDSAQQEWWLWLDRAIGEVVTRRIMEL